MIAEIVSVGTELLLGNVVNTNAAYLGYRLSKLGITSFRQTVTGDNLERLANVLAEAASRANLVVVTGGLGPTEDDLTREAFAKISVCQFVEDPHSLLRLHTAGFSARKQTEVPVGSTVFANSVGYAPGFAQDHQGTQFIFLPGPPREMQAIWEEHVESHLLGGQLVTTGFVSHYFAVYGVGETKVEARLQDLVRLSEPTVAVYADGYLIHIRLTGKNEETIQEVAAQIRQRFGPDEMIETPHYDVAQSFIVEATAKGYTVATAESITAGGIAAALAKVAGASSVLTAGFVTYQTEQKVEQLGLSAELIAEHGVVSAEVARQMALAAMRRSRSTFGLGVTGWAGPTGDTAGLVFGAVASEREIYVQRFLFHGNRENVQMNAVKAMIGMLYHAII